MSGAIRWPATSNAASYGTFACSVIVANVGVGQDVAGAQDLADPALVATEDRQAPGQLVGKAGPGRDLEAVVAQDADRRRVGAQGALGLVDDHPEEVGPIVRGGQPSGDPEDRVEPLGELGLEGAARLVRRVLVMGAGAAGRIGHVALGSGDPTDERPRSRRRRAGGVRGVRRRPVLGGLIETDDWARAHVSMVAPQAPAAVPPSVLVAGRTIVPRWSRGLRIR